jgi:hypothetical protein
MANLRRKAQKWAEGHADDKTSSSEKKEPRRVFNEPPYSSETHFMVKMEVIAHLEGFHDNDNPELTAEEIQEKVASGEMVVKGFSGNMTIITKDKRKAKEARFGDLTSVRNRVVSLEPIEGVPEDLKEADEFIRNWKAQQ